MAAVNNDTWMLILLLAVVFGALAAITTFSGRGSLDSIKSKTVGDGQHGTARWATPGENQEDLPLRPLPACAVAERRTPPERTGAGVGLYRKERAAHGPGGFGRHSLPHDRRLRRGQDRLLPVSQPGICLRQRHELLCQ